MTTSEKKFKTKKAEKSDDLSRNNGKKIRFRLRVQEEQEAEQEIKHYKGNELDASEPMMDSVHRDSVQK